MVSLSIVQILLFSLAIFAYENCTNDFKFSCLKPRILIGICHISPDTKSLRGFMLFYWLLSWDHDYSVDCWIGHPKSIHHVLTVPGNLSDIYIKYIFIWLANYLYLKIYGDIICFFFFWCISEFISQIPQPDVYRVSNRSFKLYFFLISNFQKMV
jgi:hypothetical protein